MIGWSEASKVRSTPAGVAPFEPEERIKIALSRAPLGLAYATVPAAPSNPTRSNDSWIRLIAGKLLHLFITRKTKGSTLSRIGETPMTSLRHGLERFFYKGPATIISKSSFPNCEHKLANAAGARWDSAEPIPSRFTVARRPIRGERLLR